MTDRARGPPGRSPPRSASRGDYAGDAPATAIDVAILCAGGPARDRGGRSRPSAPGGTVVALGLSGAPTIPFDFDGLVVRDIDLIGVLGSVGYWPGAIELIAGGHVQTEPIVTAHASRSSAPATRSSISCPPEP